MQYLYFPINDACHLAPAVLGLWLDPEHLLSDLL